MKKLIERALPFTTQYSVTGLSITGIESDWCTCENCGRAIANKATVQDSDGTSYTIGLDCLQTLVEAKAVVKNTYLRSQDEINDAATVAAFVGFATGAESRCKDWMFVRATKSGKTKQCFSSIVKRYAPAFWAAIPQDDF